MSDCFMRRYPVKPITVSTATRTGMQFWSADKYKILTHYMVQSPTHTTRYCSVFISAPEKFDFKLLSMQLK